MQVDSQSIMIGILAVLGGVPILVLIVSLAILWKTRRIAARIEDYGQSLSQIRDTAAITQAALARYAESGDGLRTAIEQLGKSTEHLMAEQRTTLEQAIAGLGTITGTVERQEEIARQFQSSFSDAIGRFEQASGRFLAAQQAVFAVAHDQLEKTAEMLATPANGAHGGRLSQAANRIGGILRGVMRPTPALKPPEPQTGEAHTIETEKIPGNSGQKP